MTERFESKLWEDTGRVVFVGGIDTVRSSSQGAVRKQVYVLSDNTISLPMSDVEKSRVVTTQILTEDVEERSNRRKYVTAYWVTIPCGDQYLVVDNPLQEEGGVAAHG